MRTLALPFFIGSSLFLQAIRTAINAWIGWNSARSDQGLQKELPLKVWKNLHRLIMGELLWALWCFHLEWIFIILAGNKDNHKSLNEFEFLPSPITNFWVSCPWVFEKWMYNAVGTLATSLLIKSYSFFRVTRTAIKAWMGLRFGKFWPRSTVLAALECLKKSP